MLKFNLSLLKKSGSLVTPRNQNNQTQKVIRCTPGTSRFQGQGTPKSSRSGNKFRTAGTSSRGPARDFDDTFMND